MVLTSKGPSTDRWTFTRKMLLIMKLTAIFVLVATLTVSAGTHAQKISINVKDADLEKVFASIKAQTNFSFLYKDDVIRKAGKVNINIRNASLETVLDLCFKDQPLTYKIFDNTIVISEKQISPKPDATVINELPPPIDISGRVTDTAGNPLVGASVTVRGTKQGTKTDIMGLFFLKGVDENATLEISYAEHETVTIKVENRTSIEVSLKRTEGSLQEVIINKGYYTEKQKYSVSNVGRVTAKEIEKQPVNNPLLALQGRVPGVTVVQENGLPGGPVTIRVQGQNSIQSGNDPLIVIDGVPYPTSTLQTALGQILGTGNSPGTGFQPTGPSPLNFINPQDIESIEVLKDADATAIYGSRAANGAILITTKKGKVGSARVDVNLQQGWGKVTRKMDMLNTRQYLDMRYEAYKNDGINWTGSNIVANDLKLWDTTRYTDWQKELIGGTAHYTNVNATISGGVPTIQYLVGATYNRQTAVFPGDFADNRGSVHFSLSSNSNNRKLKIQLSGNYMYDDNVLPGADLTNSAVLLQPLAPKLYNDDGTLNWALNSSGSSTWDNPLVFGLYQQYSRKTNNLISNLQISYTLFPGLELSNSFGYNNIQGEEYKATPLAAIRPENRTLIPSQRSASFGNTTFQSWIIEPQLAFKKVIGKGQLEMLAGGSIQQRKNKSTFLNGTGYSNDQLLGSIVLAPSVSASQSFVEYKYNALFSRLNYVWDEKYVFNTTFRRDGSSRFGDKSKLHNFWSTGFGWIFSQEQLIKKHLSFLSFGKLRGSYGTTGNDQIGDYGYLNLYAGTFTPVAYQGTSGLQPARLHNPHLQWEETKKLQMGIDLGFFKDRVILGMTYARNRSSNQLLSYALPTITGFSSITSNFPALVQNSSWEYSISTVNFKTKKFSWTSYINLTLPKNKLVSFPNIEASSYSSGLQGVIVGQPLGVVKAFTYYDVDPATGVYRFLDSHGAITFTPGSPTDRTSLINPLPKFYGGIQNAIEYKGFQLDFLFQFVKQIGNSFQFNNGAGNFFPGQFFPALSNQPVTVLNHWQKPGDIAIVQKFSTTLSGARARLSDGGYTDDASYIRLKNLSLSWQSPEAWRSKLHLKDLQLYLQGQNLITITKYKGLDPEIQGISGLPPLRIWTVGIKAGL